MCYADETMRSALLLFSLVGLAACSSDEPSASDAGAGAGAGRSDAGGVTPATGCDASKLRTGLVAKQTGVNVDAFDCAILAATAKYHEPDPMIFKAIIYVESRFDRTSVACPNNSRNGAGAMRSECAGSLSPLLLPLLM